MKRWMARAALVALALGSAPALFAQDEGEGAKLNWFGSLRVRPEYNENMSDVFVGNDDKIGYVSYRANIGTQVTLDKNVSLLLDLQSVGKYGEDSPLRGSQTLDLTSGKLNFYQAYVEAKNIFGEPFSLRIGRQELALADEWLLGNNDFYGGLSWDAIRADWAGKRGNLTAYWAKVVELDSPEFVQFVPDNSGDFDQYGLWYAMTFGDKNKLDLGAIYWLDHTRAFNDQSFTDKRFTYTVHWAFGGATGPFAVLNGAIQNGRTVDSTTGEVVDIDAGAYEATGGWAWNNEGRFNRAYLRIANYTGDDPSTTTKETFNPLGQDFHDRYGYLDFWWGNFQQQAYVGGDPGFTVISAAFETQLASSIVIRGVAQRMMRDQQPSPSSSNRNLGQEFGIGAYYDYGKNVRLEFAAAQLYPGTAFANTGPFFSQSTVRRLYVSATAKF